MYINGIDYDLIRYFKTGWVENTESTVEKMSKYKYNIDANKFSSENIYGWNDLDNIGKIVVKKKNDLSSCYFLSEEKTSKKASQ